MQMGHRRTHDQVDIGITMVKPVHDLPHKQRHLLGRRTNVRGRSAIRTSDLYTTPTILTGLLILLEVARIEVEIEHDTIHPPERGITGHDANVIHRPCVAGERHPVLIGWVGRLVAARYGERLILGHMESLDPDRALG